MNADLSQPGRMVRFDANGNLTFGDGMRSLPNTPQRQSSSQMSVSMVGQLSQGSQGHSSIEDSGLNIRVNFSNESIIVRSKVEMMVCYIHEHLTTTLKDKNKVNKCFHSY